MKLQIYCWVFVQGRRIYGYDEPSRLCISLVCAYPHVKKFCNPYYDTVRDLMLAGF